MNPLGNVNPLTRPEQPEQYASDGNNPWAPFFGDLSGGFDAHTRDWTGKDYGLHAGARLPHESYNLPDAYKGKSRHLEDVLDFMRREEDEFYTRDLLPWELTDDINVQWDIFRFNRTLADIEPEQGVPRLVTAETDSRTDRLIRRGLAFQLEHGFFTTDRGRRHFMLNLEQITDAIHTTAYFGVMHALLTGKNHYKEWRRRYDRNKRRHNLMRYEKNMWAILQKDLKGLYIMDAEIKHDMGLNNVTPNVLVLPSKASIYAHMVPSSETKYMERGPGAHEALASGSKMTTFRGSKVFEAESFDVDFTNENVDLLTRDRMIGEYFVMKRRALAGGGTRTEDIQIFCAEHDKFMTITGETAQLNALNGQDARFASNLLEEMKQSHFRDPTQRIEVELNRLRNDKRWTAAAERALDAIGPGAPPAAAADIQRRLLASVLLRLAHLVGEMPQRGQVAPLDFADLRANSTGAVYAATLNADYLTARGGAFAPVAAAVAAGPAAGLAALGAYSGQFDGAFNAANLDRAFGFTSDFYANQYRAFKTQVDTILARGAAVKITAADIAPPAAAGAATLGTALLGLRNSAAEFAAIHANASSDNLNANDKILLFRPFSTWRMGSAISAQGGRELGSTFHGHHDFQLSDDVVRKTILGHYTFYSKSVVKRPKQYAIIEDVYAQGYVSGGGIEFFTQESLEDAIQEQKIGTPENRKSLIAWIVRSQKDFEQALDLFGKLPETLAEYDEEEVEHFPGSDQLSRFLDMISPYRNDGEYLADAPHINTVCFRGAQKDKSVPAPGGVARFKVSHLNHGHWGKITYDGCMAVREGRMVEVDKDRVLKFGDA